MRAKLPRDVKDFLKSIAVYKPDREWGPDPVICRWCGCWLYSMSNILHGQVESVHAGAHKPDCVAVKYLGASTKIRKIDCKCKDKKYHKLNCSIPTWKEPYLT